MSIARHHAEWLSLIGVAPDETLEAMLAESANSQQEVTDQLGYQVRHAVEVLIHALDRIDKESHRSLLHSITEPDIYEAALTVMMRLIFLLSAEERKLLPLGELPYDRSYAASTLQDLLRKQADQLTEEVLERRYDAWSRLLALFRLVYGGADYPNLNLRAYDGHLFDPDRFPFLEGRQPGTIWREAEAKPLLVDNRTVLHLLEALHLLQVKVPGSGPAEARRLSFRALDIEQIGHVYEGLLDHTVRRASEPLLGLSGAGNENVEVALSRLEELAAQGEQALLDFLKERTGRTASALQNARKYQPSDFQRDKLNTACDDNATLLQRVLPFAGLLRSDSFGNPLVIPTGSVYMTTGTDRRVTGTYYTPRSLTEPLVKHTLDPLVYIGPAEGLSNWQLRPAADILKLKVCDMAMGSGAFLVQACRYLSEKLVEAWENTELSLPAGSPRTTLEGLPSKGVPGEVLLPKDTEERLALARRLVAERCLYGVDKNPMAVEVAKLSLWLITLDKERPFTFLDHALCSGDSLLGVNIKQLTTWSMDTNRTDKQQAHQTVWIERPIKYAINTALSLRRKLRLIPDDSVEQIEEKMHLLKEADEAMALVKLGADLLIATTLHGYTKNKQNGKAIPHMEDYAILVNAYEDARTKEKVLIEHAQCFSKEAFDKMREQVDELLGDRHPFHWPLAYPEAFVESPDEEGFAALLSNPPFQGGGKITGTLGTDYREYLVEYLAQGSRGQVDLCAYFFLRAGSLIRQGGQCCLLATNSIAQGDTRKAGLDQMTAAGWTIPRAVTGRKWPGDAALEVVQVWLIRGDWHGVYFLDEEPVEAITSFLTVKSLVQEIAYPLFANIGKAFKGSETAGIGFVLEPEKALDLIKKDSRNRDVLFPYLNADDVNTHPDQSPGRWVINFHNWPLELAETYPDCMKIIQEKVKPERQRKNTKGAYVLRNPLPQRWWIYGEKRPALYTTIAEMKRILVIPRHSKYMICSWKETGIVFSDATCVIASGSDADFAIIQCTFHSNWTNFHGSTLETRMRYTPTDCFETFPFPANLQNLDNIGERYHQHRQSIMLTRQEGLTQTYNRFHNPHETAEDIVRLRELHREMDEAVAVVYGWYNLSLGHGFHETKQGLRYTISEVTRREVLSRLLKLNHERYAEEVARGLHDKVAKSKGKKVVAAKKESKARAASGAAAQGPSLFDLEA